MKNIKTKINKFFLLALVAVFIPIIAISAETATLEEASPLSYGAKGDNTADDGPAFQRAIDALKDGGTLNVPAPASKYAISTEIIITKSVKIKGAGQNTILRANSNNISSIFQVKSGGDWTSFSNFRIEGSKHTVGGAPQRGIYFNGAKRGLVENITFSGPMIGTGLNFGVVINGEQSGETKIFNNIFERLVSSSGNGTAILIEGSAKNQVMDNKIDGTQFTNADGMPGAAIFLSSLIGGKGSSDNIIAYNEISKHPQAGIALNSTTYYEFSGNLGEASGNIIANNDISYSNSSNGGDASSGIVIVGNSNKNRILNNSIHHNGHLLAGGFGIVISGSQKGTAQNGQPKIDEVPNQNEIEGNYIYNNQDDGIRIKGAKNTIIRGNSIDNNGRKAAATFRNIYVTKVGGTANGSGTLISENNVRSSQLAYQIGIGPGVPDTKLSGNFYEGGAQGVVEDLGTFTMDSGPSTSAKTIKSISYSIPAIPLKPVIIFSEKPLDLSKPAYMSPTPSQGGGAPITGNQSYSTPSFPNVPVQLPIKSAPYNFGTVTLRNGSRGEAVKELQRFLNQVLKLGLVIDGKLGPKTIEVIKTWQKNNGLVPDGLVGAKTKAIMNETIK